MKHISDFNIDGVLGADKKISKVNAVQMLSYLEDFTSEFENASEFFEGNPNIHMVMFLIKNHFEAKTVTPTSLIDAANAPYSTANRRMHAMIDAGLIEQRTRTATGKSFTLHPSAKLLDLWIKLSSRIERLTERKFAGVERTSQSMDYYFGGSYLAANPIPPLQVLQEPLKVTGGVRVLVHGDPTFMVMDNLKRQFEQIIGTQINQRAFSIDRLREEALLNAKRTTSRYDIIAVDLPWVGEFVEKDVLMPLDEAMDVADLDTPDFHTAGWQAAHWEGRPYGVPAQTTPELLFYRRDMFAEAGITPPSTCNDLLDVAKAFHKPSLGQYGIAWNAARGTALGHTVLMAFADFGQPIVNLPQIAGGFSAAHLSKGDYRATIDTPAGLKAAEFLLTLLKYSPPDILSMSWYERIRPYAIGTVPMAYGYTLLAPYFELDASSPACGQTGYMPHPSGCDNPSIAPVGGYLMGIPRNLSSERLRAAVEALKVFTSAHAQKLYIQNGSRTNPRYSVGSDPEVRRSSPIFEAMDGMAWRDELQYWPRPPVPEICDIIQICGEEFHDMLRGTKTVKEALARAQMRADEVIQNRKT